MSAPAPAWRGVEPCRGEFPRHCTDPGSHRHQRQRGRGPDDRRGLRHGHLVADLGYRALWIGQINNWPTDETTESYYTIDNNWIHEFRGTVRYRFN